MLLLEVQSLESGYNILKVLWGIDLYVKPKERVILLGVNGAGKTTLLKAIMGLLKIYNGKIYFEGKDITHLRTDKRVKLGIAYMSEIGIFPNLTVDENLELGAFFLDKKLTHIRKQQMYEYFQDLLKHKKALAGSLSGGQRKMLGIAKLLMSNPKLVVLDEPSNGLSPKFVKSIINILDDLQNKEQFSILIAEQNIAFLDFAQRGYVIDNGKAVVSGNLSDLKSNDIVRKAYFGIEN
jgi:branched-chain amino acid transport system ATP-binding protein